jgi:hypothetical protein
MKFRFAVANEQDGWYGDRYRRHFSLHVPAKQQPEIKNDNLPHITPSLPVSTMK